MTDKWVTLFIVCSLYRGQEHTLQNDSIEINSGSIDQKSGVKRDGIGVGKIRNM